MPNTNHSMPPFDDMGMQRRIFSFANDHINFRKAPARPIDTVDHKKLRSSFPDSTDAPKNQALINRITLADILSSGRSPRY